jgi:hypothetical protein
MQTKPNDISVNTPGLTLVRPGAAPTHDDVEGGKRWHYLTADGAKTEPPSYIYVHIAGGFGGECNNFIYPDGYSPFGPASREHIEGRIEAELAKLGHTVITQS